MGDVVLAEVGESIDAGGVRTNVLQAGEGAPVVLVHGSGPGVTAYANWRLTVPDLAARFRVIAPDMAGFGRSDKPGGYGMKLWTGQLLALLDALGLERCHWSATASGVDSPCGSPSSIPTACTGWC